MAYIKKIKAHNVSGVVTAYADIVMAPGGAVNSWSRRFVGRIRSETIKAAPTNKRPRWAHYGKPLKATIKSSKPDYKPTKGGGRIYAGVAATAPHAYYVDQGTGIFGGNGPYEASILPPWQPGSPSLYEATWRPQGLSTKDFYSPRVAPVIIKGQVGQKFMEKGLSRAFDRTLRRAAQLPSEGVVSMTKALAFQPRGLERAGNTMDDGPGGAFRGQLAEWREWRDEAWDNHSGLGRGGGIGSKAQRRYYRELLAPVRQARREAAAKKAEKALRRLEKDNAAAVKAERLKRAGRAKNKREAEEEAEEIQATRARILQNNYNAFAKAYRKYTAEGYNVKISYLYFTKGARAGELRGYRLTYKRTGEKAQRVDFAVANNKS